MTTVFLNPLVDHFFPFAFADRRSDNDFCGWNVVTTFELDGAGTDLRNDFGCRLSVGSLF